MLSNCHGKRPQSRGTGSDLPLYYFIIACVVIQRHSLSTLQVTTCAETHEKQSEQASGGTQNNSAVSDYHHSQKVEGGGGVKISRYQCRASCPSDFHFCRSRAELNLRRVSGEFSYMNNTHSSFLLLGNGLHAQFPRKQAEDLLSWLYLRKLQLL